MSICCTLANYHSDMYKEIPRVTTVVPLRIGLVQITPFSSWFFHFNTVVVCMGWYKEILTRSLVFSRWFWQLLGLLQILHKRSAKDETPPSLSLI